MLSAALAQFPGEQERREPLTARQQSPRRHALHAIERCSRRSLLCNRATTASVLDVVQSKRRTVGPHWDAFSV